MKHQLLLHEMLRSLDAAEATFEPSRAQQGFLDWLKFNPETTSLLDLGAVELVEYGYTALAYLGYQAAIGEDVMPAIAKGCSWWVGRDIRRTDGEYQAFALDVISLLGIALGALKLPDDASRNTVVNRILECLDANSASFARDSQKSAFADVCRGIISGAPTILSSSSAATACPLLLRLGVTVEDKLADAALAQIFADAPTMPDGLEAALYGFCIRTLLGQTSVVNLDRPTVGQILTLLASVEAGLLRWPYGRNKTSTWEVANEYDVQAMLYLILKPLIPELKEEEWLSSVGTKKPRADLSIPSLRLLIEVKFVRSSDSFNSVLGQVSEDKGFYLRNASPYAHLLVFVWDDTRRTESHAGFKQGIAELGLDGAVVVSRPSTMVKPQ